MAVSNDDILVNGVSDLTIKDETQEKDTYTLPACPKPFIDIKFDDTETVDVLEQEYNNLPSQAGDCVEGEVVECKLLSRSSPDREVKEYYNFVMSCDDIKYSVGDTVGVLCQNKKQDVEKLRNFLKVKDNWT